MLYKVNKFPQKREDVRSDDNRDRPIIVYMSAKKYLLKLTIQLSRKL